MLERQRGIVILEGVISPLLPRPSPVSGAFLANCATGFLGETQHRQEGDTAPTPVNLGDGELEGANQVPGCPRGRAQAHGREAGEGDASPP